MSDATYIEIACPKCRKGNIVCLGRMDDMTAPDVEGYKCWNCGSVGRMLTLLTDRSR